MPVSDFANAAAAVSGGYVKTQIDRNAQQSINSQDKSPAPRFLTVFSKPVTSAAGDSGRVLEAHGESNVSAAAADTQAVAALNKVRQHYYGGSPGRASGDANSPSGKGGSHTTDTT